MKTLTRNETADFLLNNDNYAILTHRRPDGDTIGSSAALCRILRKMGKTAHIIRNGEVTDRFAWLHEGLTKDEAGENDTIITVDVASPGMLPKEFETYLGRIALRIDHHASATSFTDRELVIPESAACAEIVADLAAEMGVSYTSITVTSAKTRWGSCSGKNAISYTFRLLYCPREVIDYVVVHELCHILQHNHSNEFYKEIEKILPDYKEREKLLRA